MTNSFSKLTKALDFGSRIMELRDDTYEDKPVAKQVTQGALELELQPTQRFIELTNGLNKMGSERGWLSDTFSTNFITSMGKKAAETFGNALKNVFYTQLPPQQRAKIKSAFNMIGHITDGISTFTGTRSTNNENVFTGDLEVITTSRDKNYNIYEINPLKLANGKGILSHRYLVKRDGSSFTTEDLKWLGNCQVTRGGNGEICKDLEFNPSLEDKRCASQILLDQDLDSCQFVSKLTICKIPK